MTRPGASIIVKVVERRGIEPLQGGLSGGLAHQCCAPQHFKLVHQATTWLNIFDPYSEDAGIMSRVRCPLAGIGQIRVGPIQKGWAGRVKIDDG
jgi:hypothetical protein